MKIHWRDFVQTTPKISDAGKNFVTDVMKDAQGKVQLEATIRATHSGHLITGRCYTGRGMRAGCPSWYSKDSGGSAGFDKPVIRNHDLDGDPIGRVIRADFTQLKTGQDWEDDWRNPDTGPSNLGSGYITTIALIKDPDAIEKIADGRLNTVSTRQAPEKVWCSVCGKLYLKCEDHEIGKYYETEDGTSNLCYAVTGNLDYVELSYVNAPRQPNAKTLSVQMLSDAIREGSPDIIFVDSELEFNTESVLKLCSNEDKIDVAEEKLPATSVLTDKTKVVMPEKKNSAPEKTVLEDDAPAEKESISPEHVFFTSVAKLWKDHLDLESSYEDSNFIMGITNKADGHAHAFDGFLDSRSKIFSGRTHGTGQGKASYPHCHSIWEEEIDMNASQVTGDTRDADMGTSHIHSFVANMNDAENTYVILIPSVESIKQTLADADTKLNEDTFDSEQKAKLVKDETQIIWSDENKKICLPLISRLNKEKRSEVILSFFKDQLEGLEDESEEQMNPTIEKLIQSLMADKEQLQKDLAAAVQLADSKETERQKLLEDNKTLKGSVLKFKATLVAKADAKLEGKTLNDEQLTEKVEELIVDEKVLDSLVDSKVIENLRKEPEVKKTVVDMVGSADKPDTITVVDVNKQTADSSKKKSGKSLEALISRLESNS